MTESSTAGIGSGAANHGKLEVRKLNIIANAYE